MTNLFAKILAGSLLLFALSGPAAAERSAPWMESTIGACAGGAVIGAAVAYAGGAYVVGPPMVAQTAGLFCGLSVAATWSAQTAMSVWRGVTGLAGW
jgi:hypothetical protein